MERFRRARAFVRHIMLNLQWQNDRNGACQSQASEHISRELHGYRNSGPDSTRLHRCSNHEPSLCFVHAAPQYTLSTQHLGNTLPIQTTTSGALYHPPTFSNVLFRSSFQGSNMILQWFRHHSTVTRGLHFTSFVSQQFVQLEHRARTRQILPLFAQRPAAWRACDDGVRCIRNNSNGPWTSSSVLTRDGHGQARGCGTEFPFTHGTLQSIFERHENSRKTAYAFQYVSFQLASLGSLAAVIPWKVSLHNFPPLYTRPLWHTLGYAVTWKVFPCVTSAERFSTEAHSRT